MSWLDQTRVDLVDKVGEVNSALLSRDLEADRSLNVGTLGCDVLFTSRHSLVALKAPMSSQWFNCRNTQSELTCI